MTDNPEKQAEADFKKRVGALEAFYDACLFEIVHASKNYLEAQDENRPNDEAYWRDVLALAHSNLARVEQKLGFAYAKQNLGLDRLGPSTEH